MLIEPPNWITDAMPDNEDIWCVIEHKNDWEFAYWAEGTGCWDCPDIGWIQADQVAGWFPLPALTTD